MKIAIIIGHSAENQGAKVYNGSTEWAYNIVLCYKYLAPLMNGPFYFFWKGTNQSMKQLAGEIVRYKPDLALELHLNAFNGTSKIERVEALWLMYRGEGFSKIFLAAMAMEYGADTKSIVTEKFDRGYMNLDRLAQHEVPSLILEPCFADTQNTLSTSIIDDPERYAKLLVKCIEEYKELENL